jgi:hypothetical protein
MTFVVMKTTAIPAVTEVRFYADTEQHIRDEHPEVPIDLPSIHGAVRKAIEAPSHIEKSYANSYIYVDKTSTNVSGDPLRVPVKVVGTGTSARVKTAYFASDPSSANVVWRAE